MTTKNVNISLTRLVCPKLPKTVVKRYVFTCIVEINKKGIVSFLHTKQHLKHHIKNFFLFCDNIFKSALRVYKSVQIITTFRSTFVQGDLTYPLMSNIHLHLASFVRYSCLNLNCESLSIHIHVLLNP